MKSKFIKNVTLAIIVSLPTATLPMGLLNWVLPKNSDPADMKQAMEEAGKGLAQGLVGELSEAFESTDLNGHASRIGASLGGLFQGGSEAFKDDGAFDTFTTEAGGGLRRGVNRTATGALDGFTDAVGVKSFDELNARVGSEIKRGTATIANEFGAALQEASLPGGEFDNGMHEFGDNVNRFADQVIHKNLAKAGGIGIGTVAGCATVLFGIPLAYRMLERRLTTPQLIIDSSQKGIKSYLMHLLSKKDTSPIPMIFAPELASRLDTIVKVTGSINKRIKEGRTKSKYRNLMLYGPPGTGKTMFAKELAKRSGMEYAFMSGSSFAKFKDGEGIEALDTLFSWANRSKGLMIFIDEAETFLAKREKMDPNSKAYLLLNNFLNHTGERSNKFMLVFATNHKNVLDSAMYRRIDDLVEMPLPDCEQRFETLRHYRDAILLDEKRNDSELVASAKTYLDEPTLRKASERTKGLSYGDLEGIINILKTDAEITDPAVISSELIESVIDRAVQKHNALTNDIVVGLTIGRNHEEHV
jgi:hypothetical protein